LQPYRRFLTGLLQAYGRLTAGFLEVYCRFYGSLSPEKQLTTEPIFYYIPSLEINGISDTSIKTFKYGQELDIFGTTPSTFFFS
jgi:hypothetical protein